MHKQQSFDTTEYENYRINQREQRLFVQKKTFTKWMNSQLIKANKKVDDIFVDLSDGIRLLKLLEIISGEPLGKPSSGQMRIHKLENVNKCLKFLTEERVKFENISAEDIVDCNQKLILGLIWSIILRFQIKDIQIYSSSSSDDSDDDQKNDVTDGQNEEQSKPKHSPKEALLLWCQKRIKKYQFVNVTDFGESWRNGMAFNALIHSHRPELIDYRSLDPEDHIGNLNHAFEVARDHLDIQPLLDAEDVDTERPDEPSILTYVSSFYHTIAPSGDAQAPPPEHRSLEPELEDPKNQDYVQGQIEEVEIKPVVKSIQEVELTPTTDPEPEINEPVIDETIKEDPNLEAEPKPDSHQIEVAENKQEEEDNLFIWILVVAVSFTILRSVFHDTANWFMNQPPE